MPNQKSQKLKFQVSFLGLNIAKCYLIGSSDADFHKDSESGLNSKIKNTKESFVQITVELIHVFQEPQSEIVFHKRQWRLSMPTNFTKWWRGLFCSVANRMKHVM